MISLFPKCRSYMILGGAVTFMFFAALLSMGQTIPAVVFLLLGLFATRFLAEYQALKAHQKVLSILYYEKNPEQFIHIYEPLMSNPKLRDNVRFTMQTHLINAHITAGSFEKALELLDNMPAFPAQSEAFGKSLTTGNRCLIYCHQGDLENAQNTYDEFVKYGESIVKKQQRLSYIESKNTLTIRMKVLKQKCGKQDAIDIRGRLNGQVTPLQKAELQYLLGRIYLILKENAQAQNCFKEAAGAGEQLYAARKAAEMVK